MVLGNCIILSITSFRQKMNSASLGKQDSACGAFYKSRKNHFETKLCHCQPQFLKRTMRYAASAYIVTCRIALPWYGVTERSLRTCDCGTLAVTEIGRTGALREKRSLADVNLAISVRVSRKNKWSFAFNSLSGPKGMFHKLIWI